MKVKNCVLAVFSAAAAVLLSVSAALAQLAEVNVEGANIRSGPGVQYPVRTGIGRGVQVNIVERSNNWVRVVAGQVEGWIYAPFLTIIGSSGSNPNPTPPATGSQYESIGSIDNARYSGSGIGAMEVTETRATIYATARGETGLNFAVTYYGALTFSFEGEMRLEVDGFASTYTRNQRLPANGGCEIRVSGGDTLNFFSCQAIGFDHGRTVYTAR